MTSPKLQILARQMARQSPEKISAPATDDLTAAIERLVQERVSDALEQQQKHSPKVQRLISDFNKPAPRTSFDQIEPPPKAPAPKAMEISFQRNELNLIAVVNVGDRQFRVQRNELGDIVRMVPADIAPMPPCVPPPALPAARQYHDGEPR